MTSSPTSPCDCIKRHVETWDEDVIKDGRIVRLKIQFECCECGRCAVVKVLDEEEKP